MAGEKCTEIFLSEIKEPSKPTGVLYRAGGKRKAGRGLRGSHKEDVNRDRVNKTPDKLRRWVWHTAIATFNYETRTLIFKDGGYHTKLTKHRLNQILKHFNRKIFQSDREWYLRLPDGTAISWRGELELDIEIPFNLTDL